MSICYVHIDLYCYMDEKVLLGCRNLDFYQKASKSLGIILMNVVNSKLGETVYSVGK